MKLIQGDLLDKALNGEFTAILHGCNCFHIMGSAIALAIKKTFPEAFLADLKTKRGDRDKLGTYSQAVCPIKNGNKTVLVLNGYTQYNISSGEDVFEYEAFRRLLRKIRDDMPDVKLGMPLIGCGLARGDKDRILKIIEDECNEMDVTIVVL
jgi:O-acetyl-ADP-ribose deacetylase (regulator of RNase III)